MPYTPTEWGNKNPKLTPELMNHLENGIAELQTSTNASVSGLENRIAELKNDLSGKANSFHTHTKSQITDFPSSLPANGGNASTVNGHTVNSNVPANAKFTDTNTWIALKGATTSAAGTAGYAPAPAAGAANRYLRSDGTWSVPPDTNTTYHAATQSTQGLMSAADKKKLDGIASGATANTGTVTQVKVGTSTYNPSSGVINLPAYPTSLPATGDSKDCTVTFTSGDSSTGSSTPPAVITSGETHKSLFNKISTAVKNVRWLLSKMGTTDISSIGNGTVTGALSTLNSNINYVTPILISKESIKIKPGSSYQYNMSQIINRNYLEIYFYSGYNGYRYNVCIPLSSLNVPFQQNSTSNGYFAATYDKTNKVLIIRNNSSVASITIYRILSVYK